MTAVIDEDVEEVDPSNDDAATLRRVLWFAGLIVALLLVRSFVAEPMRVRSDSMAPSLSSGAVVLVDRISLTLREPRRGEVVVAADPRTGESIVKRVVAVGGDSVGIENGVLVVNGVSVVEDYIDNHNMDGFYFGPDAVPAGHVFLLGDNRSTSEDSRAFGPVSVDDVAGRVLVTLWSSN